MILCLNLNQNLKNTKDSEKISKYLRSLEGPALTFLPYKFEETPKGFSEL